jgi:hypothetical protein
VLRETDSFLFKRPAPFFKANLLSRYIHVAYYVVHSVDLLNYEHYARHCPQSEVYLGDTTFQELPSVDTVTLLLLVVTAGVELWFL